MLQRCKREKERRVQRQYSSTDLFENISDALHGGGGPVLQGAGHEIELRGAYVAIDALYLRELWAWPAQPRTLREKEPPCMNAPLRALQRKSGF